jgi:hypothetical protein
MKKIFIYNLYSNNQTITDNKLFKLHKECIKYYKYIFDELVFYLTVDDLENKELISDLTNWITETCCGSVFTIKVRKNTKLCESETFKNEVLDRRREYKDCLVFFAHSKNVTRINKDLSLNYTHKLNHDMIPESLLKWCASLYFYSFNFIDEMEKLLYGLPRPSEIFYGPLLTQLKDPSSSLILRLNKGNCYYSGTFYWINMNKFNNYIDRGIIDLPLVDDRFWVEMLPGSVAGRNEYGEGCSSHNDIAINDEFNLYNMNDYEWDYLLDILGNKCEFYDFYDKVKHNIPI